VLSSRLASPSTSASSVCRLVPLNPAADDRRGSCEPAGHLEKGENRQALRFVP
jgi:hypothetical protein